MKQKNIFLLALAFIILLSATSVSAFGASGQLLYKKYRFIPDFSTVIWSASYTYSTWDKLFNNNLFYETSFCKSPSSGGEYFTEAEIVECDFINTVVVQPLYYIGINAYGELSYYHRMTSSNVGRSGTFALTSTTDIKTNYMIGGSDIAWFKLAAGTKINNLKVNEMNYFA